MDAHGIFEDVAHDSKEDEAERQIAKGSLDSRLDYMMEFLEGGHVKSALLSEVQRGAVLSKVKASMEWKREERATDELKTQIKSLDALMVQIVSNL